MSVSNARVLPLTEPTQWGVRRRLFDGLDKLRLAQPAARAYEFALAARSGLATRRTPQADGLPLPPAQLRAQVGPAHADAGSFLQSGQAHADLLRGFLREDGASIEEFDAILDWGCGCGRILRHWASLPRTRVYGCDINPSLVEWCRANLDFAEVSVNDISPPLPYPDSTFDFVYALSVYTHLTEDLQHSWMQECRRVVKPNGYLLFTTMGEYYLSLKRLTESERQSFVNGELVVLYERSPGTNLCSAYHPHEFVSRSLAPDLDLVLFRPAAPEFGRHDVYLFRNRA